MRIAKEGVRGVLLRAHRLGKFPVVERGRVCAALDAFFVHDGVDGIGGDTWADSGGRSIEDLS